MLLRFSPFATRRLLALAALLAACAATSAPRPGQGTYFPTTDAAWERRQPAQVGMDAGRLEAAVQYALSTWNAGAPKTEAEMVAQQERFLREQMGEPQPHVLGPMKPPKGVNGLILRHGYIVAEFGDTREVDLTASLTKSILSTVAGVAFDRGVVPDVNEPVGARVKDGAYDSPHNARITWRHHLQQTSEWEGELWGMTDVNDRRGELRTLPVVEPGTRFGYNDVRVNRLSLSLLRLMDRPLPEVLRDEVMDPIGASRTWEWHGYRNSWVTLPDGRSVQSVSGGAHWGGGFWVNSYDLARLGLLYLRGGEWNGRTVLSREWIRQATAPSPVHPGYGFLFWLNTEGRIGPRASRSAFSMNGGGGHYCFVDPEKDVVIVVKSLGGGPDGLRRFVDGVMGALEP